jgi:D-3-phosphoglycerate dehydrogenase / 2-oxoglutarate reductase
MSQKSTIVLATTSSFGTSCPGLGECLGGYGLQLVTNPLKRKLTEEELLGLMEAHHPVGLLAGTEPVTRRVLEQARPCLRVISRVGVGWDNVDHAAAAEFGFRVYRTAGVLTQAVAELTIGLMLAALRSVALQDRQLRQGVWKKCMGGLLQGKKVGLIGLGDIGKRVGELVRAFGAEVLFYDVKGHEVSWARRVPLAQLLEQADIISLHASGKNKILGAEEFKAMGSRGVILINTARGELIDEEALGSAVHTGAVGCACLDVFQEEPYRGTFCAMDNMILTPHIGSYAQEARQLMEQTAVDNLIKGLKEAGVL